jgi:hypothetical protein
VPGVVDSQCGSTTETRESDNHRAYRTLSCPSKSK